jgi:Abortive infection C-terminus/AbiJ N-terminal domain 3
LHSTSLFDLVARCEHYGLESGTKTEAVASKQQYVLRRLEKLSDQEVLQVANLILADHTDDPLQSAVERLSDKQLVSDITRRRMAQALDGFSLTGTTDPPHDSLTKQWPDIWINAPKVFAIAIKKYIISEEILNLLGFFGCSQIKMLGFIEYLVNPSYRKEDEQKAIVEKLDPLLRLDGFTLAESGRVSGCPIYRIQQTAPAGSHPADELISEALASFDEAGVREAWRKALERRSSDPEGAITSAKTLLETVCKHIIEDGDGSKYGYNDDLPKLYYLAAVQLNLAPSQHTELLFKSILGNCQSVVGQLSSVRNKLGDSHGQGRGFVRPKARHAELAVNLAGTMAMFLIATWREGKGNAP